MDIFRGRLPGLNLRRRGQVPIIKDAVAHGQGQEAVSTGEELYCPHVPVGIREPPPQSPARNVPNFNDALYGTQAKTASVTGEAPRESLVRFRPRLQQRLGNLEVRPLPTRHPATVIEGDDGFAVRFKGPRVRTLDINARLPRMVDGSIPQAHGAVPAAAEQRLVVGHERDLPDLLAMATQRVHTRPGC